ncbi:transposase [Burkholderia pseudomallei]|nr:transposase [Burkholderia pseudomallei]
MHPYRECRRSRPRCPPRHEFAHLRRRRGDDAGTAAIHQRGRDTGHPHGSGLGKVRWVVKRTHAWLHHFRRLRIRFERRADIHEAFLKLGCCLICWNTLRRAQQPL